MLSMPDTRAWLSYSTARLSTPNDALHGTAMRADAKLPASKYPAGEAPRSPQCLRRQQLSSGCGAYAPTTRGSFL